MCSAGVSSCSHVQVTEDKKKKKRDKKYKQDEKSLTVEKAMYMQTFIYIVNHDR